MKLCRVLTRLKIKLDLLARPGVQLTGASVTYPCVWTVEGWDARPVRIPRYNNENRWYIEKYQSIVSLFESAAPHSAFVHPQRAFVNDVTEHQTGAREPDRVLAYQPIRSASLARPPRTSFRCAVRGGTPLGGLALKCPAFAYWLHAKTASGLPRRSSRTPCSLDPTKAAFPFLHGNALAEAGHTVQIFLLGEAVSLMRSSVAHAVVTVGWPRS